MTAVGGRMCHQDGCDGGWPAGASWEQAFADAWPSVERRLRDTLRARRVPAAEHEDYVQEVAARAIASRVSFHCASDLFPWAATVLRRLHIGDIRRGERLRAAAELARRRTAPDAASVAVARIDLDRVADTLAAWSASDRDTLLAAGRGSGRDAPESGASYVRRHRLRAKLLTVIDGLPGVVWIRRFGQAHAPHAAQAGELAASMLTPAAIACAALVLPFASGSSGDGPSSFASSGSRVGDATASQIVEAVAVGERGVTVDGTGESGASADGGRSAARGRGPSGSGSGGGHGQPPSDSSWGAPVEPWVEVEAGDKETYVGITNEPEEPDPPLWCTEVNGVVAETCFDQPGGTIKSPVPPPW